jgi:hypothetical protein
MADDFTTHDDDFIVLCTGDELSLLNPDLAHFKPLAIAWGLSQTNRYVGQALRPYNVAEHSLLVCDIAERELGLNVHGQFAALMHDAHEFVATDMHTPGKRRIGPAWHDWEAPWQQHMRSAFAMHAAATLYSEEIKRADNMALAIERKTLLPPGRPWPVLQGVEVIDWVNLYSPERRAMDWEDWRDRFLDKLHELDFARKEDIFTPINLPDLEP